MNRSCLFLPLVTIFLPLRDSFGQATPKSEIVELEAFVVTANPFAMAPEDLVSPTSVLGAEALQRSAQSSLGATLDGQAGVHSSDFGPGAGRPVIRGFDGDRVRILNQGTDTFDVSQTSPDHGVSIEPLFAERVEVLRGPATLLYGNAAIGGVVNVVGKEMPRSRAREAVSGAFRAQYGSAAQEKNAALTLQGGKGAFAWSAGYLNRASGDIEIPGFAESAYQRASEEEEHRDGDASEDEEEAFGVLPNSFVDTRSGYLGAAWIADRASLGVSIIRYESDYGVPGHEHEHEHGEEEETHVEGAEEGVSIDLDQVRYALRGTMQEVGNLFESVELQLGYGDYRHIELEDGAPGTTFERDGYEARLTGVHRPWRGLSGAVGLHLRGESFSAIGEEAFVPSNQLSSSGLFLVERMEQEWGSVEFGGRVESNRVDPDDVALGYESFSTLSLSAGALRRVSESSAVAVNLSYAERAPNASELFAYGVHAGTGSFQIGDAQLGLERSANLDLSFRRSVGFVTGSATVFVSDFKDYVFLQQLDEATVENAYGDLDTGGFDVYRFEATDAWFRGFELELRFHVLEGDGQSAHLDLLADQTKATRKGSGENLPRIPTRRFGARYEWQSGPWLIGVEGRYHFAARHLAPSETPTDGYTMWGCDLRYRIHATLESDVDLFIAGRNLGDAEARPSTSFLKDTAPLAGRNWDVGVRTTF